MTRQQEGDEARSGFICGAWTIREQGPILNYEQPYIRAQYVYRCDSDAGHEGDHADSVLLTNWRGPTPEDAAKAKLPTPEETTLPAMDVTCDYYMRRLEKMAMCNEKWSLDGDDVASVADALIEIRQSRKRIAVLEAERDALKAELSKKSKELSIVHNVCTMQADRIHELKLAYGLVLELHGCGGDNCTEELYLKNAEEMIAKLGSLKAALDAVVGQETPQDAWIRGFQQGWMSFSDEDVCEIPPYTPPLKGQ